MLKIPRFYIFISYVLQETENVGGLHDEEDALVDVLEDGGQGDGADGPAEAPPVLLLVPAAPQRGHGRPQDDRVEADGNLRRGGSASIFTSILFESSYNSFPSVNYSKFEEKAACHFGIFCFLMLLSAKRSFLKLFM